MSEPDDQVIDAIARAALLDASSFVYGEPADDGPRYVFTRKAVRALYLKAAALERDAVISALRAEIDHCAANDLRMAARVGRSVGDPGVPAGYVEAVIERFSRRAALPPAPQGVTEHE
jgi:hypothetical protein